VSVSPLSSNSAALDLLTSGHDGSTASAALARESGAAAADPSFQDLFQPSGDPALVQAAHADPGLASERSALQAPADPPVGGDSVLNTPGDPPASASPSVPGQVNQDVIAAYQMAGALSPDTPGIGQPGGTSRFNAFA
jgi:hypothetical protein